MNERWRLMRSELRTTVLTSAIAGVTLLGAVLAPAPAVAASSAPAATPAPQITAAPSPKSDDLHGGNRVTVTGTGFTQVTSVRFGNTPGTALSVTSATSLKITAPAHPAGYSNIRVLTTHGTSPAVAIDHFRYVAPPVVTGISPATGSTAGGNVVCISGTDFADLGTHVRGYEFVGSRSSAPGRFYQLGPSCVQVVAPGHGAGSVDIIVVTDYGTSRAVAADRYSFYTPTSRTDHYSIDAAIPQTRGGHIAVSCGSGRFCVGTDDYGKVVVYDGTSWSAPTTVEPGLEHGSLTQYGQPLTPSCTAPRFCVLLDGSGRAVTTTDGRTWSAPVPIAPSGQTVHSVSCVTPTFCLAVSDARKVFRYDGTSWSAQSPDAPAYIAHLSCVSTTFCMATSNSALYVYDGTQWTLSLGAGGTEYLLDPECSSALHCVAVEGDSDPGDPAAGEVTDKQSVIVYDGTSWSTPYQVEETTCGTDSEINCFLDVVSASCSRDQCAAVTGNGRTFRYSGGSWAEVSGGGGGVSVSCTSASFCASTMDGFVRTYDGRTWSPPTIVDPSAEANGALSCVSATFCAAASDSGASVSFFTDGDTWGTPSVLDAQVTATPAAPGLSCTSSTFCVAVSGTAAYDYDGSSWSSATTIDTHRVRHVSCGSNTFCVAVDDAGGAAVYDGSSWSNPVPVDDGRALVAISCTATGFCAGADASGHRLTYSGGRWSAPTLIFPVPRDDAPTTISCTSSTFCVSTYADEASTFDGTAWGAPVAMSGYKYAPVLLSCTSPTFCEALGSLNGDPPELFVFDGTTWSAPHFEFTDSIGTLSCVAPARCVAGGSLGYYHVES